MEELLLLREAIVAWAAGVDDRDVAVATTRELAARAHLRKVALVEGVSDRAAIEALAERSGRDLDGEGVCVVPMGGATSIGRFLGLFGSAGLDVAISGLCDEAEVRYFSRALERANYGVGLTPEGLESLGFFVCVTDLEDELIRALGTTVVESVIESLGDLPGFRTFQRQPAQRSRTLDQQLKRFVGTRSGRKTLYARAYVEALDLDRVPRPLELLLANF